MKKVLLVGLFSAILASSLAASESLADYKQTFMGGCTAQGTLIKENENLCNCVWKEIEKKYSLSEIKAINSIESDESELLETDFGKTVVDFSKTCINQETKLKNK